MTDPMSDLRGCSRCHQEADLSELVVRDGRLLHPECTDGIAELHETLGPDAFDAMARELAK